MSVIRLCICPCGRVSVQEPDVDPLCHKCGDRYQDEIDWFNLDGADLIDDLKTAIAVSNKFQDTQEAVQISTETRAVTGGFCLSIHNQKPPKQ